DGRAILRADVRTLAIECGRVVDGEEDFQQFAEGDNRRVIGKAYDLGMACVAAAHLAIGWVGHMAVAVAGLDANHPAQLIIDCFETPETTTCKGGDFGG